MKRLLVCLILSLPCAWLGAESAMESRMTHSLELLTPDASEPVSTEAVLSEKDHRHMITIALPTGLSTAEYVLVDPNQVKFQFSEIKNDKLLTIQFVGTGDIKGEVKGRFAALVDSAYRPDMSGTFVLKVIK